MKIQGLNSSKSFSNSRIIISLLAVFALVLCSAVGARAQITTAAIRGTVMDDQGAAIAGADVTFTGTDTGFTRSMKSGTDGEYNFPELPLGIYSVHITYPGFKSETQTGIVLHVNDSLVLNVNMKVGQVSETVTVEASPVEGETTSGGLTDLIEA